MALADTPETVLPAGVKAVWNLEKAQREKTATRERVCLNGLWRWQPAHEAAALPPRGRWGYFKVPGFWPGRASYDQEDCQTLFSHPSWKNANLGGLTAAWYQREITVPDNWTGRRVALSAGYANSFAVVFVDGKKAGEIRFPAGEVDLTAVCRSGKTYLLSLFVVAMPLKAVLLSYIDTNSAKEVKGTVERRGLCGDVYLVSTPAGARINDVKIDTSVRKGEIAFSTALAGLAAKASYTVHVEIRDENRVVNQFTSKPFKAGDLKDGRFTVSDSGNPKSSGIRIRLKMFLRRAFRCSARQTISWTPSRPCVSDSASSGSTARTST